MSNWEQTGPHNLHQCTDKKVIRDTDLELDELKPKLSTNKKNKKADKTANSSPISRNCLIYKDGHIERPKTAQDVADTSQNHH